MVPVNFHSASVDFQAWDDAWYTVNLALQGEVLTVKFIGFSDAYDEKYKATDFKTPKDLEGFIEKFRPTSLQLQDYECNKAIEGSIVCASYVFNDGNEVKFYDAVVAEVSLEDHKFENGEELCNCKFELYWLLGPNAGTKTKGVAADICLIRPGNPLTDPTLSLFTEISREKHEMASQCSVRIPKEVGLTCDNSTSHNRTPDSSGDTKKQLILFESRSRSTMGTNSFKHCTPRTFKGRRTDRVKWTVPDEDLQGNHVSMKDLTEQLSSHCMLIENLEKDLSPSAVVDFLKKRASLTCQAVVLPSLSSESYARGILVVGCQEEFQKLSEFLDNPAHIILSSRGRPWVITEKKLRRGSNIGNLNMSDSSPCDTSLAIGHEITIAKSGSEEFKRGKQLRELYLEFADHQRSLHQQFALEESKLLL
ncbi:hypothetical protein IFM89_011222 [Coptis chinensis]|uniref:SAWADEE domain-containing protein n=1 Tax=Coptis chinensis TaxID=261450 RepID=A0A835LRC4_9MAGN|nr:hypothetical protein IFM89_011222 [Coptis chinensis]